ncbi:hypothetical protein SAMN02745134_00655 [Clostridium acidisoli DSM 12555]|uniref:Tellurite resistance protein TerB n=1 Tax=Clostridium acidisoli DSM 12555 TaxID=1121291 RepID=A0A1W1X4V1_9CLOT|nr:hypothetical protein [Clostridium acidisoli]SMC18748.1 hypothetical protein SAMN02745134_00655 [Clostridium acidisoli DSM 12555]
MFLNLFNQEEKENFLELVYKIANLDGNYDEDEKELINNYKIELSISDIPDTTNIETLIKFFSEKSEQIQKIVWFELYAVIMADDVVAVEETKIINLVKNYFTISEDSISNIQDLAKDLKKVYERIYNYIF